jgi:hypothetical protein
MIKGCSKARGSTRYASISQIRLRLRDEECQYTHSWTRRRCPSKIEKQLLVSFDSNI